MDIAIVVLLGAMSVLTTTMAIGVAIVLHRREIDSKRLNDIDVRISKSEVRIENHEKRIDRGEWDWHDFKDQQPELTKNMSRK